MNENGLGECTNSGTDECGVWLSFENGTRKYIHVFTSEDIARQIRIYGENWVAKIAAQKTPLS